MVRMVDIVNCEAGVVHCIRGCWKVTRSHYTRGGWWFALYIARQVVCIVSKGLLRELLCILLVIHRGLGDDCADVGIFFATAPLWDKNCRQCNKSVKDVAFAKEIAILAILDCTVLTLSKVLDIVATLSYEAARAEVLGIN